jgi:hypothetical protein
MKRKSGKLEVVVDEEKALISRWFSPHNKITTTHENEHKF